MMTSVHLHRVMLLYICYVVSDRVHVTDQHRTGKTKTQDRLFALISETTHAQMKTAIKHVSTSSEVRLFMLVLSCKNQTEIQYPL